MDTIKLWIEGGPWIDARPHIQARGLDSFVLIEARLQLQAVYRIQAGVGCRTTY